MNFNEVFDISSIPPSVDHHLSNSSLMINLNVSFFFPQKDNVRNQRENVVLTIANAQSRLGIPVQADPVSSLDNLCHYLIRYLSVPFFFQKNIKEAFGSVFFLSLLVMSLGQILIHTIRIALPL